MADANVGTYSDCTIVRNISGHNLYFDWLGPRGATINNGQDRAIPGNPLLFNYRNQNKINSMEYALEQGLIVILQTPYVLVFDAGAVPGHVALVGASGGLIVEQTPDYGSYYGSAPNP